MAGNAVNLEFAGDASKLAAAAKKAEASIAGVGGSATSASDDLSKAAQGSGELTDRMSKLGSITTGAMDAVEGAAGSLQALADVQDFSRAQAERLARAQGAVEQATLDTEQASGDLRQANRDLSQSFLDVRQAALDGKQAQLDVKQANLDATIATREYAEALKKHGKNSEEARQAAIDLEQAHADVKQAQLDSKQATEDAKQATEDGSQALRDAGQALRSGKDAQLDLNAAQREANPPDLQKWADQMAVAAPLMTALVGVVALVTAAQWAWNAAQLASPTTWIVLGIVALVAVIVLIATKTTWFQTIWRIAWGGIKAAAGAVGSWFKDTLWGKYIQPAWNGIRAGGERVWTWMRGLPGKLKGAFASVGGFISAPFRAAFNLVSTAWNNTIGRLHWSVPGWVPGIGGNSISAPRLPRFHQGGRVPGAPGSEVVAMLQAGETVTSGAGSVGGGGGWVSIRGDAVLEPLVRAIADRVAEKGGRAAQLGIRFA